MEKKIFNKFKDKVLAPIGYAFAKDCECSTFDENLISYEEYEEIRKSYRSIYFVNNGSRIDAYKIGAIYVCLFHRKNPFVSSSTEYCKKIKCRYIQSFYSLEVVSRIITIFHVSEIKKGGHPYDNSCFANFNLLKQDLNDLLKGFQRTNFDVSYDDCARIVSQMFPILKNLKVVEKQ